jgi:predicted GNAT family N-acyltransferase
VIEVRAARDEREVEAALALREEVFCGEQGVSLADERDGRDGEAVHLVAVEDGRVLGTCRLLLEGTTVKLGRMAVARAARGRGLGRALLDEADVQSHALGAERIALAAQLTAQAMYERAGYEPYGDVFLDAGIEHVMMEKALRA